MKYNASKAVNTDEWLSRDEAERIRLVSEFHRSIGDELPNLRLHAAIHAIVENQIAMDESAGTRITHSEEMEKTRSVKFQTFFAK